MTRDDIIRMAKEAGIKDNGIATIWCEDWCTIERFAALVSAAEREACAKICEELPSGMFAYEASYAIREEK